MASGAATLAAAFAIGVVQFARGRRAGAGELLALAILATAMAVAVLCVPALVGHAQYKAHSAGEFVSAWMEIAGWPMTSGDPLAVLILCAVPI